MLERHTRILQSVAGHGRDASESAITDGLDALIGDLRHSDAHVRASAAEALGSLGPTAAPATEALAARVDAEKPGLWEDDAYDPNAPNVIRAAVEAIGRIGPDAKAAVPALLRDLLGLGTCTATEDTLDVIAPVALPELVEALTGETRGGQRDLERMIARLGGPALPTLRAVLRDDAQPTGRRIGASAALRAMGPEAAPALPDLLACALRPETARELRQAAVRAVGRMGSHADGAISFLLDCLEDRDVSTSAEATLAEMGARAVPALIDAVETSGPRTRATLLELLRRSGCEAEFLLDRLEGDLSDASADVRWRALAGLGKTGLSAREALPDVRRLVDDERGLVRAEAVRTIGRIAPRNAAVPVLIALFEHPAWNVRSTAAMTVGALSPAPTEELAHALGHESPLVRRAAATALGYARPPDEQAVQSLRLARADEVEEVRQAAVLALDRMSRESRWRDGRLPDTRPG